MDQIWQDIVCEAPRLEAEQPPRIERQVYEAIRRARRGHDHMTAVTLWVMVPKCMGCVYSEARWLEEEPQLPQGYESDWAMDYRALGFSRREIQAVKRGLEDGSWRPRCYRCGSSIDVVGEGFCVRRTSISEYFGLKAYDGKPPKWMKGAVLRAFGNKCPGCRKRLTPDAVTIDHVVATSKGGRSEVANLQPLCQPCNAAKGDQDVESVDVMLTFALRPAPSDGFAGVIWEERDPGRPRGTRTRS